MPQIVYVLINAEMPGLVKIGITEGEIEDRVKGLDNTSVPVPFECFYAAEVSDAAKVERAIHEAFEDHRVRKSREFFRLSPDKPKAIIELLCLKNVTPGIELFSEEGDEEALAEAKKRRANFNFSTVGIKPGTVLQSVFDDTITCTVKGDRWVEFRGQEESLSSSALIVAHENGYGWTKIAGPQYWKYEGKTLSELRAEKLGEEE
jgi:T5orf172 domain